MITARTNNINRNSNRLFLLRSKTYNINKIKHKRTKKLINLTRQIIKKMKIKLKQTKLTTQKKKKNPTKKTKCPRKSSKKCAKAISRTL